ncbi:hypothetical protein LXL04_011475 [Taraxacum kok-saghyz]
MKESIGCRKVLRRGSERTQGVDLDGVGSTGCGSTKKQYLCRKDGLKKSVDEDTIGEELMTNKQVIEQLWGRLHFVEHLLVPIQPNRMEDRDDSHLQKLSSGLFPPVLIDPIKEIFDIRDDRELDLKPVFHQIPASHSPRAKEEKVTGGFCTSFANWTVLLRNFYTHLA